MSEYQLQDMEYGKFDEQSDRKPHTVRTTSESNGHVCVDNTWGETLGIGEVKTGAWEDTLNYNNIIIGIGTTQDSVTNGLDIQWSHDGVSICDNDVFSICANKSKVFTFTPARRYVRLVYTNGITSGDIDVQTIFKKGGIKASSHRLQDHIVAEDDAELVKAVLTGEDPNGTFNLVQTTEDGNLSISDNSSGLAIAKGDVTGHSNVSKFGQNSNISTVYEDIWDVGGTYNYPANGTAPITYIDSDDALDTEPVEVQGLDITGALTVQTKTLTGTTPVELDTPLWRVFRMKNMGTSDFVGNVQAVNTADTVIYAQIQNGNNQTLMALYTIPLGKTGYLQQGTNSLIGSNRDYTISGKMMMRPYGGVFQLKRTFGLQSDGTSYMIMPFPVPGKVPALTDIKVSAMSSAAGGGLNTTFELILVDN